jgi:hypothetical protein
MKLVKRKLSAADNRQHPFLNFTITVQPSPPLNRSCRRDARQLPLTPATVRFTQTHTHTIVQDVPLLSKPMSPVELKEVRA